MEAKQIDPSIAGVWKEKVELLKALANMYGRGVINVADRLNREHIVPDWKAIGQEQDEISIRSFVNLLWETYCRKDGLEFSVEAGDEKIQIHCTYCPWVALMKELDATDIGSRLICQSDPYMVEGFNQAAAPGARKIKFTRTKTLMQGDDCCDHCYEYE